MLAGKSGCRTFASVSQWRTAAAPQPAAQPSTAAKKLTWNEQRELEKMEEVILQAEEHLHSQQKLMQDPKVLADHVKLRAVCAEVDAAQVRVQTLYDRWQVLEARKK